MTAAITGKELSEFGFVCDRCGKKCPIFRYHFDDGEKRTPGRWLSSCVNQTCPEREYYRALIEQDVRAYPDAVRLQPNDYLTDLAHWLEL